MKLPWHSHLFGCLSDTARFPAVRLLHRSCVRAGYLRVCWLLAQHMRCRRTRVGALRASLVKVRASLVDMRAEIQPLAMPSIALVSALASCSPGMSVSMSEYPMPVRE